MTGPCARDELRAVLLDHGVEPYQADALVPAIAGWAKDQDEDWPWDDGTPPPDPTDWSQHPSITDPRWLAERYAFHMEQMEQRLRWLFRGGNPTAFQRPTPEARHLGPQPNEKTEALAAHWARTPWTARTATVTPWQPHIRLCPYRTGGKLLGADIIVDPTLDPNEFTLNGRTFTIQ